jgi:hypothetical protein
MIKFKKKNNIFQIIIKKNIKIIQFYDELKLVKKNNVTEIKIKVLTLIK